MNKKTIMSKIFIDDIFPLLSKEEPSIPWPSQYSVSDKISYLSNLIKFYEKNEEYSKCDILNKIKNKLEKMYDNQKES